MSDAEGSKRWKAPALRKIACDSPNQLAALRSQIDCTAGNEAEGPSKRERVRAILKGRRLRDQHFGKDLFADPAWDMLLTLYLKHVDQQRISVSEVCQTSAVPATTALRWIRKLESEGWVLRSNDPRDARRVWLELTDAGKKAMDSLLDKLPRVGPI